MGVLLGVDGGNTKTCALVASRDGTIVGRALLRGCADIYGAASTDEALDFVGSACDLALRQAGADRQDVEVGAFSLAGADWPEDIEFLDAELAARGLGTRRTVVNDAVGALWAGLSEGVGVAVALGTGAATSARGPDGTVWHTSFWQGPQGARHLARQAVEAASRAELGIDPPTSLQARVPGALGLPDVESVLHAMYGRDRPRPVIDDLAALLLDEAEAGDERSREIVADHASALADYALAAARRVGIDLAEPFGLVLIGGVLRHPSRLLAEELIARVAQAAPRVEARMTTHEPAVGALRLAFEAAGLGPGLPREEQLAYG